MRQEIRRLRGGRGSADATGVKSDRERGADGAPDLSFCADFIHLA